MTYTARYTNFARVRRFEPGSPEAPMMYEFVIWLRAKWEEWAKLCGRNTYHLTPEDHAAFDVWLSKEAA
jgi:hypothetical protein